MSFEALGRIIIFDLGPAKSDPERRAWEREHGDAAAELQCFPAHGGEMLENGHGRYVRHLPQGVKLGPRHGTNRIIHC
jgi:hypothetical protein